MSSLRSLLSNPSKLQRDCQRAFERAVKLAAADWGGFVSANGGGVLGTDGVVRWTLSSVTAGASGDVNVTLKAPTTSVVHALLLGQRRFATAPVKSWPKPVMPNSLRDPGTILLAGHDDDPARPAQAPPNGSLITLVITDRVNGALASRIVAVNFTLAASERLNSPRGRLVFGSSLT
jgi:hypothetical protein